jgi:mannose-6-phosphate isomerase-like protein (cupin superfamily)
MATLTNPVARERIVFLFADDTVFRMEEQVPPDHIPPPVHIHRHQEERFEVVEGRVTVSINGHDQVLEAGGRAVVPARAAHTWRNSGEGTLRMITEFRPPLHMQDFFETYCGLATEGACDAKGAPHFLQIAASCPWWDMYLTKPPVPLQRMLFALLAPLVRLKGYRATHERFQGTLARPEESAPAQPKPAVT